MKIQVHNETEVARTFRANRVRSLFNVDDQRGSTFELDARIGAEKSPDWKIGLVVGPSGSGKSSIGRELEKEGWELWDPDWGPEPIVEEIGRGQDLDSVTGALAAVGLGDVPSWLRPHGVLSTGEKFRANLARLCVEQPGLAIVDEFTSVVDRQIARIGSMAFSKAWRRGSGQVILLSCHHDIVEWLQPDWCFDTESGATTYPKATRPSSGRHLSSKWSRSAGATGPTLSRITI